MRAFFVRGCGSLAHTCCCRLVLRIQSAYLLDSGLTNRQTKGGKIAFRTLLRATYLGKRIRG